VTASDAHRIAVTGVGMISALATDAPSSFARLVRGEVGFAPLTLFDASGLASDLVGEVSGFELGDVVPSGEAGSWSRADAFALAAVREAIAHAELPERDLVSVIVGATTGGMLEGERMLAGMGAGEAATPVVRKLLRMQVSASAQRIARVLGRVDQTATLCSACSSGAAAVALGAAWLRRGRCERVVAGGTDSLCLLTLGGFSSLGAIDPRGCRPFDVERAGLTLGEGAAFLVLEPERAARARGARVLAWLSGWALGSEAHHITQPDPSGQTAAALLREAIGRAGLQPAELDYVNAHGTGTRANDAMEARALASALGPELARVFVSSSKGQLGHTLGAAGALEAVITVLALDQAVVPPTMGLREPDPEIALLRHVTSRGEPAPLGAAASSSFGFGGAGAVLVFEPGHASPRSRPEAARRRVLITGVAGLGRPALRGEGADERCVELEPAATALFQPVPTDPLARLEPERSRRFDPLSSLVSATAEQLIEAAGLGRAGVGLTLGVALNPAAESVDYARRLQSRGGRGVRPAEFPRLLLSAAASSASIYCGLTGPVLSVSDGDTSGHAAVTVALDLLEGAGARSIVAGASAVVDPLLRSALEVDGQAASARDGTACLLLENEDAAQARGSSAWACVCFWDRSRSLERLLRRLPQPTGGSGTSGRAAPRVVTCSPSTRFDLAGTGWEAAPRTEVAPSGGVANASSAMAIAVGAMYVHHGIADEVLVIGAGDAQFYATQLARP